MLSHHSYQLNLECLVRPEYPEDLVNQYHPSNLEHPEYLVSLELLGSLKFLVRLEHLELLEQPGNLEFLKFLEQDCSEASKHNQPPSRRPLLGSRFDIFV